MNIVVNGGTRGIGKEVVLYLSGFPENRIVVTGRNISALKDISDSRRNVHTMQIDLSEFDRHAGDYYTFISSKMPSVDILINTAGLLTSKSFMDFTNEEARKLMETNFFGTASAIRILRPLMKQRAHIVNISSMGGYQGSSKYAGLSYYSASKAAIACLTECLAEEFKGSGISVNCLALGSVQTEMLNEAFPGYEAPVSAAAMGRFIAEFALTGSTVFNGKILPVAVTNP